MGQMASQKTIHDAGYYTTITYLYMKQQQLMSHHQKWLWVRLGNQMVDGADDFSYV